MAAVVEHREDELAITSCAQPFAAEAVDNVISKSWYENHKGLQSYQGRRPIPCTVVEPFLMFYLLIITRFYRDRCQCQCQWLEAGLVNLLFFFVPQ